MHVFLFFYYYYEDCGRNISGLEDGVLQSTNFPIKYENPAPGQAIKICDWYINVRPGYKVLLNFRTFILEGSPPCKLIFFVYRYK